MPKKLHQKQIFLRNSRPVPKNGFPKNEVCYNFVFNLARCIRFYQSELILVSSKINVEVIKYI